MRRQRPAAKSQMTANVAQVRRSKGYHVLVGVGLVSYGVVHLMLAWLALQIAFERPW